MARVEIYKLKKTAPPHIREYSVFDYMRNGEKPNPLHYIREWAGEMHGTLPLTIPGKLMLEPPKDYQGGNIVNGDIAVVDGTPYFILTPVDSVKTGLWFSCDREFAVKLNDWAGIDKWAKRTAGDIQRSLINRELKKSRDAEI